MPTSLRRWPMHGLGHDERVLGIAFDGTGYGDDGAVWGGEFLVAVYSSFRRVAHLAYVDLAGRRCRRPEPLPDGPVPPPCGRGRVGPEVSLRTACRDHELRLLERQLTRRTACVPTSSMGRLFDAVASLVGVCHRAGYEAQAAIELEGRRGGARSSTAGTRSLVDRRHLASPTAAPVVTASSTTSGPGSEAAVVAARFHRAVVDLVVAVAERLRDEHGITAVTLCGGVFVNALLTSGCARALAARGFRVLRHRTVPPTDAGTRARPDRVHRAHRPLPRVPSQAAAPPETEPTCVSQCPVRSWRPGRRTTHRWRRVDFGGVTKEVCLAYVPETTSDDYVIVHVGFALQRLDEQSAQETLALFRQMGELDAEFGDHWGRADQAGLPGRLAPPTGQATDRESRHEVPRRVQRPGTGPQPARRHPPTATRPWAMMEVCGGQTHSIIRHGLDQLLPDGIELIHGPGCPVCVTPLEMIDKALEIASRPDVIFCSFGDMLRVPGSDRTCSA